MQALDPALERLISGLELAQIGSVHAVLDGAVLLDHDFRRLLVAFEGVVDVCVEGHLALLSLHDQRP